MPRLHPLRRVEKGVDYLANFGTSGQPYQQRAREGAEKRKRKKALDDIARMKKRKMTPYTSPQMQTLHRVTVAGMKNRKIMRKGPS